LSLIFVVVVVIAPDPIRAPTPPKMIATADATSRAVVVILFGPVVAVWAAVEGMTLLPSKGSGFGKGHVLPVRYIFYVFLL
jgi:hypothetical protein